MFVRSKYQDSDRNTERDNSVSSRDYLSMDSEYFPMVMAQVYECEYFQLAWC